MKLATSFSAVHGSEQPRGIAVDAGRGQQIFAGAERQDGLAVAKLVLHELDRVTAGAQCSRAIFAVRNHHRVEQHRRRGLERHFHVDVVAVGGRAPCRGARRRNAARRLRRRACDAALRATRHRPHLPPAARCCACGCCRLRAAPSATAAGETFTSGFMLRGRTAGCGSGTSMPRPSATWLREFRIDVHQLRHHALADRRAPAPWSARSGTRARCAPSPRASGCCRTVPPACSGRRTSPACRAPCLRRWAAETT